MFVAERIRISRKEKKLTQTALMFALDKIGLRVSRATLINWETGVTIPDANEIAMLAEFFCKPVQHFFDQEDNKTVRFKSTISRRSM
jgi:transcriptional regulator with XRE-family HTH domain